MNVKTMFDPSTPLATATVQDIHLELIRRSEHNAFRGARVLAGLLAHRQNWQAVLFDTYGLATDRGLPARLITLRDMASNDYNADTLYILAINEAAAHRLAALAESWGAAPHMYSQEETERALGTSRDNGCLVEMRCGGIDDHHRCQAARPHARDRLPMPQRSWPTALLSLSPMR